MNQLVCSTWRKRRRSQEAIDLSQAVDVSDGEPLEMIENQRAKRCRRTWPVVDEQQPQLWPSRSSDVLSHNNGNLLQHNKTTRDNRTNGVPPLSSSVAPMPHLMTNGLPSDHFNQVNRFDQAALNCPHMQQVALHNHYLPNEVLQGVSAPVFPHSASLPRPAGAVAHGSNTRCKFPAPAATSSVGSWTANPNAGMPPVFVPPPIDPSWLSTEAAPLHRVSSHALPSYLQLMPPNIGVSHGATSSYHHHHHHPPPNLMGPLSDHLRNDHGHLHPDSILEPFIGFYPLFGAQLLSSWFGPISQTTMYNSYDAAQLHDLRYVHPQMVQPSPPGHMHGFLPPSNLSHDGLIHHFLSLIGNYRGLPFIRNISGTEVENYEALLNLAELLSGKQPRGLTRHEVDRLVAYRYKLGGCSSASDQTSCVVCMCGFENKQMLRVLPCSHEFHLKCIDKWLKINQTCPICRASALDSTAGSLKG